MMRMLPLKHNVLSIFLQPPIRFPDYLFRGGFGHVHEFDRPKESTCIIDWYNKLLL